MCLLFFEVNQEPGPDEYQLVLASVRDEYYSRPTMVADFWSEHPSVIGGRYKKKWAATVRRGARKTRTAVCCCIKVLRPPCRTACQHCSYRLYRSEFTSSYLCSVQIEADSQETGKVIVSYLARQSQLQLVDGSRADESREEKQLYIPAAYLTHGIHSSRWPTRAGNANETSFCCEAINDVVPRGHFLFPILAMRTIIIDMYHSVTFHTLPLTVRSSISI